MRTVRRILLHGSVLVAIAAIAIAVATPIAWSSRHGTAGASMRLCTVPGVSSLRGGTEACLDRVARDATTDDAIGGLRMLSDFERSYAEPRFRGRCHILMHGVSRKIATLEDLRRIEELDGLSSCVDGFVHGGIDSVLGEGDVDAAEVIKLAETRLCPEDPLWRTRSCQHGFGHSLMRRSGNDMRQSLEDCRRLGDEGFAASCAGGAMMEYMFAIAGLDSAEPVEDVTSAEDARERCDELLTTDNRWHGACVGWLTTQLKTPPALDVCDTGEPTSADCRTLLGYNLAQRGKRLAVCDDDPDCLRGFAIMAMATDRSNPKALVKLCDVTTGDARLGCVEGGGMALRLGVGAEDVDELREDCADVYAGDEAARDACQAGVRAGETASWMM